MTQLSKKHFKEMIANLIQEGSFGFKIKVGNLLRNPKVTLTLRRLDTNWRWNCDLNYFRNVDSAIKQARVYRKWLKEIEVKNEISGK